MNLKIINVRVGPLKREQNIELITFRGGPNIYLKKI